MQVPIPRDVQESDQIIRLASADPAKTEAMHLRVPVTIESVGPEAGRAKTVDLRVLKRSSPPGHRPDNSPGLGMARHFVTKQR